MTNSNYYLDPEHHVWVRNEYKTRIEYSDGTEIENRIFDLVKNSRDVSVLSEELESHIFDWASRCFLSRRRSNLLRPFAQYFKGKHILEVGCGAGPITRFLGECGAYVYAVEPSLQRARIAAERCRDLRNVKVYCSDIEAFESDLSFDGIVQVGVLEYATKYASGAEAPLRYLDHLRQFLTEGGFLITAIENQLGLKYFAGFAEDHLGSFMHGINDNYVSGEPTTFGRKSLLALFEQAGFPINDLFLPFPDYKLPSMVIYPGFNEKSSESGFTIDSILSNLSYQDSQKNVPVFSMDRALPLIARNGLLYDLSNSFCVFSQLGKGRAYDESNILALYNTDRKKEYCKETIFRLYNRSVVVNRKQLADTGGEETHKAVSFLQQEPAFPGRLYHDELIRIVNRERWTMEQAGAWLSGWFFELKKLLIAHDGRHPDELKDIYTEVSGKYTDALPINLIGEGERWRFIDLEIDLQRKVEIGYLVFRAIYVSVSRLSSVAEPEHPGQCDFEHLLYALFPVVGFRLTEELLDQYYQMEAALVREVAPVKGRTVRGSIIRLNVRPALDKAWDQAQQLEMQVKDLTRREEVLKNERNNELSHKEAAVRSLEERLAQAHTQIAGLRQQEAEKADLLNELQGSLEARAAGIRELQEASAVLTGQLKSSRAQVAQRNRELETLGLEMKVLRLKEQELHRDRQEQAALFQKEKERWQALAADQERKLQEKQQHIDQLERQVKGMYHEIYSLSTSRKRLVGNLIRRSNPFPKK